MDLTKAYDRLSPMILIAKLECYGLGKTSLLLNLDYLTNCKQRTKIGLAFSSLYDISTGVPKGSILGALLLNIFIKDVFFSIAKSEVCNFADDNTLYSCNKNLENGFSNFKLGLKSVLKWFGKFQFMVFGINS